jgi:hypothetical protein
MMCQFNNEFTERKLKCQKMIEILCHLIVHIILIEIFFAHTKFFVFTQIIILTIQKCETTPINHDIR